MITLKRKPKEFPDLFLQERSVTKRLSILLTPKYHKSSLQELIQEAIEILNLEDTIISDKKKEEYFTNLKKQKSVIQLQYYITNILMRGSNLTI